MTASEGASLLVLGHAADRTGPPVYLVHLLRWLRAHRPDAEVEVVLLAGGELLDEMRELAPVTVFEALPAELPAGEKALVDKGVVAADAVWARERAIALRELMAPFAHHRVAYVNCAPSVELAQALPSPPEVLLSHVHEMAIGLVHRLRLMDRHLFLARATRLFSVSEAVTDELVRLHGRDPSSIEQQPEMIDVAAVIAETDGLDRAHARRARGIDADDLVVGACGSIELRKGTDHFLRLAWHLRRAGLDRPLTCVWVGGDVEGIARAQARAELMGVGDTVRFVGSRPDPANWFALMDVFVLPSREDPFPLVCIEAAAAGVPIVAFDTGGIPELLRQGCGEVIAYPDVTGMAAAVTGLLTDDERRRSMGGRGREVVREQHDVSVVAPRLWEGIERWL